jgi:hypothetical protein
MSRTVRDPEFPMRQIAPLIVVPLIAVVGSVLAIAAGAGDLVAGWLGTDSPAPLVVADAPQPSGDPALAADIRKLQAELAALRLIPGQLPAADASGTADLLDRIDALSARLDAIEQRIAGRAAAPRVDGATPAAPVELPVNAEQYDQFRVLADRYIEEIKEKAAEAAAIAAEDKKKRAIQQQQESAPIFIDFANAHAKRVGEWLQLDSGQETALAGAWKLRVQADTAANVDALRGDISDEEKQKRQADALAAFRDTVDLALNDDQMGKFNKWKLDNYWTFTETIKKDDEGARRRHTIAWT